MSVSVCVRTQALHVKQKQLKLPTVNTKLTTHIVHGTGSQESKLTGLSSEPLERVYTSIWLLQLSSSKYHLPSKDITQQVTAEHQQCDSDQCVSLTTDECKPHTRWRWCWVKATYPVEMVFFGKVMSDDLVECDEFKILHPQQQVLTTQRRDVTLCCLHHVLLVYQRVPLTTTHLQLINDHQHHTSSSINEYL